MVTALSTETDHYPTRLATASDPIDREHPTLWTNSADGPFSAEQLADYDSRGFSIVRDFISIDEVADYTDELTRLSSDESVRSDERVITEKTTGSVRSIFDVHSFSEQLASLASDPRLLERARQIVGTDVYLHQTRINYMPGFTGTGFYWHSDFETWHAEDGMPVPRAVSCQIALTENFPFNGGLMVMPGSQRVFVPSVGETPEDNYKASLKEQKAGVPSHDAITALATEFGIEQFTGPAGTALWFDSNIMHGSGNNITPFPRSNIFMVFNSVENGLVEPYAAGTPRPEYIAHREISPLN